MSFLFNNLSHLKTLTIWFRLKTCVKTNRHASNIGFDVGFLILAVVFMACAFIEMCQGNLRFQIYDFGLSLLSAFLPIHFIGNLVYHIYNSKTYDLNGRSNHSWFNYQRKNDMFNHNYYIVAKLPHRRYLTQTSEDIDLSDNHNEVHYEVFQNGQLIQRVGCSDAMVNPTKKRLHKFTRLLFETIYIILFTILLIVFLAKVVLSL